MTTHRRERRVGSIAVLSLILITVMMAFVAFAVDIGYILVTRTEMQRSADASAVASAWALIDERGSSDNPKTRDVAARYVTINKTGHTSLGLAADDVEVGRLSDPSDFSDQLNFSDPNRFNAVQVRVQRTTAQNGELPLFFARVIGQDTAAVDAQATSSFYDNIRGFRIPKGPNHKLGILPIALDFPTWMGLVKGSYEVPPASLAQYTAIDDVDFYPRGDGPPGNRGTVDIGGENNSTADIVRQIADGPNEADLAHFPDGKIVLGENGLNLNGDTGISAGFKDALADIIGEPRIIPIFDTVTGPGNTATYHIVAWGGIRITKVKLTGPMSSKEVRIEFDKVITQGVIPADPGAEQVSNGIYSYPRLVR